MELGTKISCCALVVSIFSACASVYAIISSNEINKDQLSASQQQSRLAVRPILSSKAVFDSRLPFSGIGVENKGLGPALIESVTYSVDGYTLKDVGYSAMNKIVNELGLDSGSMSMSPAKEGQIIKQERDLWLFKSQVNSKLASNKMLELYKRMTVSICYCSLYGSCEVKTIGRPIGSKPNCQPRPTS